MIRVSTLPSARDQAHRALTLLGVPATPRLVVDVHAGFFDGDLTVPVLAGAMRDEEHTWPSAPRGSTYHLCYGLHADGLAAARSVLALSTWPLARRIITPAGARADELTAIIRVAEFAAVRPGATAASAKLLRKLAASVPGGPEAYDVLHPGALADAARRALADPARGAFAGPARGTLAGPARRAIAEPARGAIADPSSSVACGTADDDVRAAAAARAAELDERQRLFGVRVPHQGRRGGTA